jgi:hypothetical protein
MPASFAQGNNEQLKGENKLVIAHCLCEAIINVETIYNESIRSLDLIIIPLCSFGGQQSHLLTSLAWTCHALFISELFTMVLDSQCTHYSSSQCSAYVDSTLNGANNYHSYTAHDISACSFESAHLRCDHVK